MATPIFILGNPRTGSSTVSDCLRELLGIQGYLNLYNYSLDKNYFLKHEDKNGLQRIQER